MGQITLSSILKSFLLEFPDHDPFEDGFSSLGFINSFKAYVAANFKEEFEVRDMGELLSVLELNEIYEALMESIEALFDSANTPSHEMIQQVLRQSNLEGISISARALQEEGNDTKNIPKNVWELNALTLKNVYGDDVQVQNASDINIEVCIELLRILYRYEFTYDPAGVKATEQELNNIIRKCMMYANLLFNFRDAFQYFRFEYAQIERKPGQIIFKHVPATYYFIRKAGKERFENHIQEHFFYVSKHVDTETKLSAYNVQNGKLSFKLTGSRGHNGNRALSAGLQTAYYVHLRDSKFQQLGKIGIQELLAFISELHFLFQSIDSGEILEKVNAEHDLSVIPINIAKKDLVTHLHKVTGLREKIVEKLLGRLSTELSGDMDLWKQPLISYGNQYYFNLHSISHCNSTYIIDQIIRQETKEKQELLLFNKYLKEYVLTNRKENKTLPALQERNGKQIPDSLADTLIVELETVIILFEPCLIPFAFNSPEYYELTNEISQAAHVLAKKQELLKEYLGSDEKSLISIVVTNFPSLSSLIVNDCFVMDHFLITNYFSSGEYQRGLAIAGNGSIETRKVTSYKYYEDSTEMSENFLKFCLSPYPVRQVMNQYELKEYLIGFKGATPEIYQDGIERKKYIHIVWELVNETEYCLRQLFYFEKSLNKLPEQEKILTDRVNYLIPQIVSAIAFQNEDRYARLRLLEIFKTVGYHGLTYLIRSFINSVGRLNGKKFRKSEPFKHYNVNMEKAQGDLDKLLKQTSAVNKSISLSEIVLSHSLTSDEVQNILEHLIDILSVVDQGKHTAEEFENLYLLIIIFTALCKEKKTYQRFLYPLYLNFIDALNFNFNYQKAKNFAEEALIFSFDNEQLPILGWLCQYKCFLKQKNILDAAFYGTLFISCVEMYPDADEELVRDALFNSMLFFRDYHFEEIENAIYQILKTFSLPVYDEQRLTLSHFSSQLANGDLVSIEGNLDSIRKYLDKNLESICSYHEKGALPWVAFLYNYIRLKERDLIKADISFVKAAIQRLEKEIPEDTLTRVKAQFFPIPELSKEILKEAILKIFESIDFTDASYELENLTTIARQVAVLSVDTKDWDALFLTGLIFNDQSLTFPKSKAAERVPFIAEENSETTQRINEYQKFILKRLVITEGQLLIWIFTIDDKVFCLQVNDKREVQLSLLNDWTVKKMRQWINGRKEMTFDDKQGSYFINEQEADYLEIRELLQFSALSVAGDVKEILFYSSMDLAAFPHNLIEITNPSWDQTAEIHSDYMKGLLKEKGTDFLSLYRPVTNIISLEWYIQQNRSNIGIMEISIQCWIPTVDEDYALMIGYDKLAPLIEDKYDCLIDTAVVPEEPLSSAINIFMAHGGKGYDGFKTIYTRNEEGHAVIKELGIGKIFGTGEIAIVFVCHSASLSPEAFSQRLVSFAHEVLSFGYRAVVAPSWAFNPLIAPVWLEEFLERFHEGQKISSCVFEANRKVARAGYNEYHGFYSPTGWAAMHLYGDPDLFFKRQDI